MSHLDPSSLAQYNSLIDPHLQSYFSNERIRSHLKHAGLIKGQGEIVAESEYRTRLARIEHKKHVRHMLAENIVNRAIDMERQRHAEMKRQFDSLAKAALVNNVKESKRRSGQLSGFMSGSMDLDLLPLDSNRPQTRPKSANYQNEICHDLSRIQSADSNDVQYRKSSSKIRRHSRHRSKHRSSSNKRSLTKSSDLSTRPCEITMVYYGPKIHLDYDHLVFEPIDEIIVMQQHCGGENVIVFKENLRSGAEFTFKSRRHSDYPFGLTLYVKGFIDSRISTCCEYKHRHGVRLGGDRGHFAIKSVHGSKPCIKCRFEKQARLKRYAQSPKEKNKPITISLPVTNEQKRDQTPVQIPVRRTSISSKHTYEDDFDGSDKHNYSTDSTIRNTKKRSSINQKKSMKRKSSSSSEQSPKKKTWQMNFFSSNVPKEKNLRLQFSFISNNQKSQTENYQIDFEKFSTTKRFNSFSVKLNDIGQPKQIKLKILNKNEDDDEEEDIQWNLDYIELIDPENQSRLIFSCKQTIRFSQEKLLQLSKEKTRKNSSTSSSSRSSSPSSKSKNVLHKSPASARSSTSSNLSKSSPKPKEIKVRYRVIIYPSSSSDGDFHPTVDAKLFIRLNNQTKETYLTDKSCPTFSSGKEQTFEIDFILINQDKPTKLTFGYINSDITAKIWRIKKIVLINLKTNEKFVFQCKTILRRNERTNRAEQTFQIETNQSNSNRSTSKETSSDEKPTKTKLRSHSPTSSSDEQTKTQKKRPTKDSDDEKQQKPRKQQTKDSSDEQTPKKRPTKDSDDEKQRKPRKQQTKDSSDEEQQTPKKQIKDSDDEKQQIPKRQQTKDSSDEAQQTPTKQIKNSDDEKEQTPKNSDDEQTRILKKQPIKDSDDEQIQTPKKQQTKDSSDEEKEQKQERHSIRSENNLKKENSNDQEQTPRNQPEKSSKISTPKKFEEEKSKQTNNSDKEQRSPSFQSMNDDEANYRNIFKQLDPTNELQIGSPPHSPSTRPKTRRGRQDQPYEQEDTPPVDPLVGLDDLQQQTGRSNDQLNLNSFPSSTTTTTENRSKRQQPQINSDDDDQNHIKS